MKLRKIYEKVNEQYRNLDLSILQENAREMVIGGNIIMPQYFDDEIYMEIYIGDAFAVTCVFDKLARTQEHYELINAFNEKSTTYRAYISKRGENDDDYLVLESFSMGYKNEKEQAQAIIAYVEDLLNRDCIHILQQLTRLTMNNS